MITDWRGRYELLSHQELEDLAERIAVADITWSASIFWIASCWDMRRNSPSARIQLEKNGADGSGPENQ